MRSMLLKRSLHSARALEEQAQKKALKSTLPFSASVRRVNKGVRFLDFLRSGEKDIDVFMQKGVRVQR